VNAMSEARHHKAVCREIIFVEVPVCGSPKNSREVKPARYPHQQREPWRPATRPPSKAEKLARLIDAMRKQDQMVREMMRRDLALLKARWGMAA
jgi:hypothetical protein